MPSLSVLMSLYSRESPGNLAQCLESLAAQTLPADEIVIVKDGPLGENLESVLAEWAPRLPIVFLELPENQGTGAAVRLGVLQCRHDWIARMDSDDICLPHRFALQMEYLRAHPAMDVLGSNIREFGSSTDEPGFLRSVPADHQAILSCARQRNPVNQMTAILRKSAVLAAGNYRSCIGFEDYDLWIRMLRHGARFHNLQDVLVLVRCGNGMQNRRGGWRYLRREAAFFWSQREAGFLSTPQVLRNLAWRLPARLMPVSLRTRLYRRFMRNPV